MRIDTTFINVDLEYAVGKSGPWFKRILRELGTLQGKEQERDRLFMFLLDLVLSDCEMTPEMCERARALFNYLEHPRRRPMNSHLPYTLDDGGA
jgi:hypothetical protein